MSAPWEKYGQPAAQSPTAGPWAKFAPASPDVTKSGSPQPAAVPPPAVTPPNPAAGGAPKPIGTAALGINRSGSSQPDKAGKPTFDDFMKGAEAWARGASFGWSDDASAMLAAAILKARGNPSQMMDIYRAMDQQENERIDSAGGAGKVAEAAGMFTGPGAVRLGQWIGRGAGWLARTGRAAAVGGTTGAAAGGGYARPGEKAEGAAIGGAVGTMAGPVVERAAAFIGPKISQAAKFLRDQGVRAPIGANVGGAAKALEEKISSIPGPGDLIKGQQRKAIEEWNRAAYNEVLAPLGKSVKPTDPIGNKGFEQIDDTISDGYKALLPKLNLKVDSQLQSDLAAVDAAASKLPKAQQQAYIELMNTQVAGKLHSGIMDGNTFKGAESELSGEIRGLASDPSWDQKKLGQVLRQAQAALRSGLGRSNPDYAGQLQALNKSSMLMFRLKDAIERLGAKDGVMMPSHLLSAAKHGATDKQFARGKAPFQKLAQAGDEVLSNKYPDSGTAGRLLLPALAGAGAALNPKAAAGVAATTLPYLLPRGWNASPFAQSSGALLRSAIPGLSGQAGKDLPRYIGPLFNNEPTIDINTPAGP